MPGVSIAMYQPKWYEALPTLDMFLINDEHGNWIKPGNFQDSPVEEYAGVLSHEYHKRYDDIWKWLETNKLFKNTDIALCCWCPHASAASKQIAQHGTYICHSAVVEQFLMEHFDVEVVRDAERSNMIKI